MRLASSVASVLSFAGPPGDHGYSALDDLSGLYPDLPRAVEENVHARTELHQANPLATRDRVSFMLPANDASRQHAGDLLEHPVACGRFHGDGIAFILHR